MISVLLIDDDPDLLEIIRLNLGDENDFSIETCNSPADAIELSQKKAYDSIVSDFYMPEMDGCSLLKLLRSRGCKAQLVLYSGKELDDEITKALTRSVDVFVQRQGNPDAEFRELKKILRTATTSVKQPPL